MEISMRTSICSSKG